MTPPLLHMAGMSKGFPGVRALESVDFTLQAGEIHALMGENGAGKSTLMKLLSGSYPADSGKILLDGEPITPDSPIAARGYGISIVHQELMLVPELTVAENIFLSREPVRFGLVDKGAMRRQAEQLLADLDFDLDVNRTVGSLSVAQQQVVEIARALSFQVRILIMDEPTSALSDREAEHLFVLLERLRDRGVGIVYISHRMPEVARLADRYTVLRDGRLAGHLDRREATQERLVRLMVGRSLPPPLARTGQQGPPVLAVQDLVPSGGQHPISFTLHAGEILGVAGLVGAGRTELARAIFGMDPVVSGTVSVTGQPLQSGDPRRAIRAGLGFVPEDRKDEGLLLGMSVQANIVMAGLFRRKRGWRNQAAEAQVAARYVDELQVRTPSLDQEVVNLSGGNQQKVVLARWLSLEPKALIVDEPTRGVDVAAKAEIHALLRRLADSGVGILAVSSELPELLAIADRIMVMHEGRVTAMLDQAEATEEGIMAHATGTVQGGVV